MGEPSKAKKPRLLSLLDSIEQKRKKTAESVMDFKFNKKRVRILTDVIEVAENCNGIVYWMFRDCRVQDNWALLFAQKTALKNEVPLHVCFCVLPKFLESTIRQYKFLFKGLQEVENELKSLNINFTLLYGEPNSVILEFVKKYNMGAVVTDFFPLKKPMFWVNDLKANLPKNVPLCQVDAHNIVPCWITSDKQEYNARTIRTKIHSQLDKFLTTFPPVIKHPHSSKEKFGETDWEEALEVLEVDRSVDEITWAKPGYEGGILELESFIKNRLVDFQSKRNDPVVDASCNLSPWFHFGMISVQRCILEVLKHRKNHTEAVDIFMDEAVVRSELGDNFCFYNENYDSINGAYQWAIDTLNAHRKDKREYVYDLDQFEKSLTHDDLWNAAQNQLVQRGKMHKYLRTYWGKKFLDWAKTPEDALKWAIYLNNRYSLDGCDPNGYVGCMWAICGIHDQGWGERAVFGKIRFMNYKGCHKWFAVKDFVKKWGGKVHTQSKKGKK